MALWTGLCCVDQRSTSVFSCPCKQEFEDSESPSCITCQLRVAEARIEVVDDDLRLATPLNTSCKFPGIEDFEQLGHIVSEFVSRTLALGRDCLPVGHVCCFLIAQRLEDVGTVLLWKAGERVDFRGDDGEMRCSIELRRRLSELRQDHDGQ